jgi:aspartate/methionine/tyrosine aminotransferase
LCYIIPRTGAKGNAMPSRKSMEIPSFIVMDVLERAQAMERAGRSVIHLEIGEPDFDTPHCIREAALAALGGGETHYTHSLGKITLREAIARHYRSKYGVTVKPENVIVSSGTSPVMLLVFAALCDPGDEVIFSDPHYACYPNFVRFVDGVPVKVRVREEEGFALRPEEVRARITGKTRAILINSPANPTGCLLPEGTMRDLAALGVPIVSDEIYHGLVYEGRERSILEFTDEAVVINGFSKLYAMTGWRLGYAILPDSLVRPMQKMQQNFFISASDFIQSAGTRALLGCADEVRAMYDEYKRRRDFAVRRVREVGLGMAVEPTGAFYVFANAKKYAARFGGSSLGLAMDILDKTGVAVAPGVDFGEGGEGYLRISYTNSLANLEDGLGRLEGYLRAAPVA